MSFLDTSSTMQKELQALRDEIIIIKSMANKNTETLSADIKYTIELLEKEKAQIAQQVNDCLLRKDYASDSVVVSKKIKDTQSTQEKSNKLMLEVKQKLESSITLINATLSEIKRNITVLQRYHHLSKTLVLAAPRTRPLNSINKKNKVSNPLKKKSSRFPVSKPLVRKKKLLRISPINVPSSKKALAKKAIRTSSSKKLNKK